MIACMKENNLYYIGYYNGDKSAKRKNCLSNIAGSMKMDFIIKALKNIEVSVEVVSITIPPDQGWYPIERVRIDENEEYYFLPVLRINIFGRTLYANKVSVIFLFLWGLKNLRKNDIVIVYHALPLYPVVGWLKKIFNFRLIIQIEEIYSLSNNRHNVRRKIKKEEAAIAIGDGYLFVNDVLPQKYAMSKPFAVSYGNYTVFNERKNNTVATSNIGIVYTGIINEERGVFRIISAMDFLTDNYSLHILGFGEKANLEKMHRIIANVNTKAGFEKVKFYGTRTGEEYTKFLSGFQIGVSLMDSSEDVSTTAFPSKILAYLGHSLFVVSSKNKCIMESKVKDLLYFCDDDPNSIANTILSIDFTKPNYAAEKLRLLEKTFQNDLEKVVDKVSQF